MVRAMVTASERSVSDRPSKVDSTVVGQPLAAPWRRLAAIVVDITIVLIPSVVVAFGAAMVSLRVNDPEVLRSILSEAQRAPDDDPAARIDRLAKLAHVLVEAKAEGLPPSVALAVEQGDLKAAGEILTGYRLDFALGGNMVRRPGVIRLHVDELIPQVVRGAAVFGVAAMYFTLMTAFASGSTLGKRLFGIQVRKLDAHPMTMWESFERFGGYFGSIGTLGLGFLDVWRDPNRRLAHDRTSNTVVVRRLAR